MEALREQEKQLNLLSKTKFKTLNKKRVDSNFLQKYKECNVCLNEYKFEEEYSILHCGHHFHKDCIKKWLCNESKHCPLCRMDQSIKKK
jgi:hypothetical protein